MQLAIVAPERVAGLVLVGTSPRGWEPQDGWQDDPIWDELTAASRSGDLDQVASIEARIWLAGTRRRLEDLDPELVELFIDMDLTAVRSEDSRDEHVETLEPPTDEQLGSIDTPTLVMVGEYDDPDLHLAARYLADRLSDRDPVMIPDAAHLPSLEQPEAFNTALKAFLSP